MTSLADNPSAESSTPTLSIALVGNPNVGKSSVFNRLTNLHVKTSNFVGTTIERKIGRLNLPDQSTIELIDLPGLFSLEADSPEERVARDILKGEDRKAPDAVLAIVDATNLKRSLFVAGQAIDLGRPTVVAVNMIDAAKEQGIEIDFNALREKLRCDVVPVSARKGTGFDELKQALSKLKPSPELNVISEPLCTSCSTCPYADGHGWASSVANDVTSGGASADNIWTDRLDGVLTNSFFGPLTFAASMTVIFALVFWLATFPMDWIEGGFGWLSETVGGILPAGDFNSFVTDGIIGGLGGVVVFLPQICILFFALSLLEDSGYLSRAVVVVDGWMRKVGLPGQAFVPLLTAHACAIPAIMSTKVIENRRDRLAAIMVIPLMTCSARLPVYSMLAALLFPGDVFSAAMVFVGSYMLGMVVAFVVAWLLKVSLLKGKPALLILDLPAYRVPSLRDAFLHAYRRGIVFLRDAGTVILVISMVIWVLSTYPKLSDDAFEARAEADGIELASMDEEAFENLQARMAQEHALIGRAGKLVEPVFAPLGYDWKSSVGVLTSFAAREVVVSTWSVLYGLGEEPDDSTLQERLAAAKRDDGSPVFDRATCFSLLVFFVLAMQCLPTQAVTKRETGSWKWAVFQFVYMSLLAYGAAFVTYRIAGLFA